MSNDIPKDIELSRHYASMQKDDLYRALVPPEQQMAFSEGGKLVRGREIFQTLLDRSHDTICQVYREREGEHRDLVALIALIAAALIGSSIILGAPAYVVAALAVKVGLSHICKG